MATIEKTVLFLDDNPARAYVFLQREPDAIVVETAAECIKHLQPGTYWDEVHLDHDLNGESFVNPEREDCGMEVVRWICLNKPDVLTFVVHSHNFWEAPSMVAALRAAGYRTLEIPFQYGD